MINRSQKLELEDVLLVKVDFAKYENVMVNWLTDGIQLAFNQTSYSASHYWKLIQCIDGTCDFMITDGSKGAKKNFELLYEFIGYYIEELEEVYNGLSTDQWVTV